MATSTKDLAMLVDKSLCVGCEACTVVCKQVYDVSPGVFRTKIHTSAKASFVTPSDSKRIVYYKQACMHCTEASCVMACPTGACHKTENGYVIIDKKLCIQCNYCIANCPFGAIQYDRPKVLMEKCTLCYTRIDNSSEPLCSSVCPVRAISFGPRTELLRKANDRVTMLKSTGYTNAAVYGEQELGGTKVLFVLDGQPESFGVPADPTIPWGLRLWRVIPLRPLVVVAAGAVLGFNFIHNRKYGSKSKQDDDSNEDNGGERGGS